MSRRRAPPAQYKPLPPVERLRELLDYDPASGTLTWRVRRGQVRRGAVAGCRCADGRRVVCIDRVTYVAARIAWKMARGRDPVAVIDHRDRDRSNDRLRNLRDITSQANSTNRGISRNNTSGYRGVSFVTSQKKWRAKITCNGKTKYLGYFKTAEEADYEYTIASLMFHFYALPIWG